MELLEKARLALLQLNVPPKLILERCNESRNSLHEVITLVKGLLEHYTATVVLLTPQLSSPLLAKCSEYKASLLLTERLIHVELFVLEKRLTAYSTRTSKILEEINTRLSVFDKEIERNEATIREQQREKDGFIARLREWLVCVDKQRREREKRKRISLCHSSIAQLTSQKQFYLRELVPRLIAVEVDTHKVLCEANACLEEYFYRAGGCKNEERTIVRTERPSYFEVLSNHVGESREMALRVFSSFGLLPK